jgi:hypothetical protein
MSLQHVYAYMRPLTESTFSHECLPRCRFWPPSRGLSRGVSTLTTLLHVCIRHVTDPTPSCGQLPALPACPIPCPFRCPSKTPFFLPPPQHKSNWAPEPLDVISVASSSGLPTATPAAQRTSSRKWTGQLNPHVPELQPLPVEQWHPTHDLRAAGKRKVRAGEQANAHAA